MRSMATWSRRSRPVRGCAGRPKISTKDLPRVLDAVPDLVIVLPMGILPRASDVTTQRGHAAGPRSKAAAATAAADASLDAALDGRVPAAERRHAAVVAEDTQRRGVEQEAAAVLGRQAEPARREQPEQVAVREQRDVAAGGAGPREHAVDALADLLGALAAGAAVGEDHPARRALLDLVRRQALVLAVVPFDEVGLDLRAGAEARQVAGDPRALQRAREHQ